MVNLEAELLGNGRNYTFDSVTEKHRQMHISISEKLSRREAAMSVLEEENASLRAMLLAMKSRNTELQVWKPSSLIRHPICDEVIQA